MRIVSARSWPLRIPLREPYRVAYATFTHADNVLLRIETDRGEVAWGCGAPEPAVTGESVAGCVAAVAEMAEALVGQDPLDRARLIREGQAAWPAHPAARAAVDLALHDLLGQVSRQPLWRLLGSFRSAIPTSITLGIHDRDETVARARTLVGLGFGTLKLKGGLDPDDDIERVRAVRAAVGAHIPLWLDANQGYQIADAVRVAADLVGIIELMEQPTPADDPEALAAAARSCEVPVIADESVHTAADALDLAGRVAGINIKIQKSGGILEARRVAAICDASGMSAMIGCMDECALGISAGLQLALALPSVAWADLDAHLDLIDDPTSGCLDLRDGVLRPTAGPGLGLETEPATG